jgi:hypothetical protein
MRTAPIRRRSRHVGAGVVSAQPKPWRRPEGGFAKAREFDLLDEARG